MKTPIIIATLLLAISSIGRAQNTVADTHPNSSIFAIDYSTGQEAQVNYDAAILFKDAFIDLASNTSVARFQVSRMPPGHKVFIVKQMDPQTNGNSFQLILQGRFGYQNVVIYTFIYNVDQNTLSFFNTQTQSYAPVAIQGYNVNNLNNCFAYGKFNVQNVQPVQDNMAPPRAQVDDAADSNTPVDADVSTATVPPALPDYDQPECPVDGYLWQPGYWAYSRDNNGYYWVPGAWVAPPRVGFLWTPPYWGFVGGIYIFHGGYWGNSIGFYGGVNYGYGYGGHGFVGGDWHEGHYRYNTAVVRVNVTVVHNTYIDNTVVVNNQRNHASFNGQGGVVARPNDREMAAMHEEHVSATSEQIRNQRIARADRTQFASANGGRPANFAAARVPDRTPNTNNANMGNRNSGNNNPAGARPGMQSQRNVNPGTPASNGTNPGAPAANTPRSNKPAFNAPNPGAPAANTPRSNTPAFNTSNPGAPAANTQRSTAPATNTSRPSVPPANPQKPAGNRNGKPNKKHQ